MEKQLNHYINKAVCFEEAGYVEEALQLCEKCRQTFPEYEDEICLEIAKMNFRNGNWEQALLQFIMLYEKTGSMDIYELVLQAYYGSRQEEFEDQYARNCSLLEKYRHFYGSELKKEIRYYPLYAGSDYIWFCDADDKRFQTLKRTREMPHEQLDDVCVAGNLMWIEDIKLLEEISRKINPFMDMENALLLVYQNDSWELLLQIMDLRDLLELDRIVFCDNIQSLQNCIVHGGVMQPQKLISGSMSDEIETALNDAIRQIAELEKKYRMEAFAYYKKNSHKILEHIQQKKARILFTVSRFTTALQYHIRDCREAAEKAGCQTELKIEKDRLLTDHRPLSFLKKIAEFRPDIIFIIDHFRHERLEYMDGLDEIVWVNWIQDPLNNIMDKSIPPKLGPRDVILSHYTTWKEFWDVGYDARRVIQAPVPANQNLYKRYELTQEETELYGCDLCFVCHGSDVQGHIEEVLEQCPEKAREPISEVYKGYFNFVYETGRFFYSKIEFSRYISGVLERCYEIVLSRGGVDWLAEDMYKQYNQRVYRQVLVDWLLDAGFKKIKLWGKDWQKYSRYADYAMGVAENGETLSKIYQSSKIVVGNNVHTTAAARAWEAMLSGAFYMSNYIPPEEDAVDIRKIIKANEELVMFYDKEDFLQKTEYYLTHEKERQKMIEIGRRAALERMTYDSLMNRVME